MRKRIDFHVTSYHRAHHQVGEAWITVDGDKVLGAGYCKWWKAFREALQQTQEKPTGSRFLAVQHGAYITTFTPETEALVMEREVYETGFFLKSFRDFPNLSLDAALASGNHFIRALAMIDRRLGRRRFDEIKIRPDDPTIVKLFYALRAEAMHKTASNPIPPTAQAEPDA